MPHEINSIRSEKWIYCGFFHNNFSPNTLHDIMRKTPNENKGIIREDGERHARNPKATSSREYRMVSRYCPFQDTTVYIPNSHWPSVLEFLNNHGG